MVIVFDGVCNACNVWVRFLIARDPAARLRFARVRSDYGAEVLAACGESPDDPSTVVLVDGDRHYLRSEAVLRAVAALGGGWRAVLVLTIVPRVVRDAAYTAFARRRYRWFGRSDVCQVPRADVAERFLP